MEGDSKKRWSDREREAAVILVSCLAIASAVLGLLVYESVSPVCSSGPCPGREALNIVSSTTNSPTNVTLKIINAGYAPTQLSTYYVKDASGQTYMSNNWSGPTISPNTTVLINIIIDGKIFTYQTGYSYTIIIVTSRNTQFTLTILA